MVSRERYKGESPGSRREAVNQVRRQESGVLTYRKQRASIPFAERERRYGSTKNLENKRVFALLQKHRLKNGLMQKDTSQLLICWFFETFARQRNVQISGVASLVGSGSAAKWTKRMGENSPPNFSSPDRSAPSFNSIFSTLLVTYSRVTTRLLSPDLETGQLASKIN